MSLELDLRDETPVVAQPDNEGYKYSYMGPAYKHDAPPPQISASEPAQRNLKWCGLRRVTVVLSAALALATILAIIAAGVGGSLAAKRSNQ